MKSFTVQHDCQISNLGEIYHKYFANIECGSFVEVGAYDGRSWTNTGFLADIGWLGLYIEPIECHINICKQNHANNCVYFEQSAVGPIETTTEMYIAGGLSTIDQLVNTAHEKIFNTTITNKEIVNVQPLSNILKKYNFNKNFELLVVDTEGYEKEVFDSFSLNEYRPKMMIVELCDVHAGYNEYTELQNKAKLVRTHICNNNYKEIYVDAINTIFWDNNEQF